MLLEKISLALLSFSVLTATGQGSKELEIPLHSPEARQLMELAQRFFTAVQQRDSITMEALLDDNFTLTSSQSSGEYVNKFQYIRGSLRAEILKVDSFHLHNFTIKRFQDVAVLQFRIFWISTYQGKPWNADFLNTDVWIRQNGKWKIFHRHSSYPFNALPAILKQRIS